MITRNIIHRRFSLLPTIILALTAVALTGCQNGQFIWETDKEDATQIEVSPEQMMAAWMEYGSPGHAHDYIAKFEGEWTAAGHMYKFTTPDGQPTPMFGGASNQLVLGGRFLKMHYFADDADMPFEGLGYFGYDNSTNKYVSIWMDSMSTSIFRSEGNIEPETGDLIMFGSAYDPATSTTSATRENLRLLDENTYYTEMYEQQANGDYIKVMDITYRRN